MRPDDAQLIANPLSPGECDARCDGVLPVVRAVHMDYPASTLCRVTPDTRVWETWPTFPFTGEVSWAAPISPSSLHYRSHSLRQYAHKVDRSLRIRRCSFRLCALPFSRKVDRSLRIRRRSFRLSALPFSRNVDRSLRIRRRSFRLCALPFSRKVDRSLRIRRRSFRLCALPFSRKVDRSLRIRRRSFRLCALPFSRKVDRSLRIRRRSFRLSALPFSRNVDRSLRIRRRSFRLCALPFSRKNLFRGISLEAVPGKHVAYCSRWHSPGTLSSWKQCVEKGECDDFTSTTGICLMKTHGIIFRCKCIDSCCYGRGVLPGRACHVELAVCVGVQVEGTLSARLPSRRTAYKLSLTWDSNPEHPAPQTSGSPTGYSTEDRLVGMKGRGKREIPYRKPADQRHCPARFPHAGKGKARKMNGVEKGGEPSGVKGRPSRRFRWRRPTGMCIYPCATSTTTRHSRQRASNEDRCSSGRAFGVSNKMAPRAALAPGLYTAFPTSRSIPRNLFSTTTARLTEVDLRLASARCLSTLIVASRRILRGSLPSRITRVLSHVGISPDDAAGQRVFSEISRFHHTYIPVLLHTPLVSPYSAPKPSHCLDNMRSANTSSTAGWYQTTSHRIDCAPFLQPQTRCQRDEGRGGRVGGANYCNGAGQRGKGTVVVGAACRGGGGGGWLTAGGRGQRDAVFPSPVGPRGDCLPVVFGADVPMTACSAKTTLQIIVYSRPTYNLTSINTHALPGIRTQRLPRLRSVAHQPTAPREVGSEMRLHKDDDGGCLVQRNNGTSDAGSQYACEQHPGYGRKPGASGTETTVYRLGRRVTRYTPDRQQASASTEYSMDSLPAAAVLLALPSGSSAVWAGHLIRLDASFREMLIGVKPETYATVVRQVQIHTCITWDRTQESRIIS
ncbi:hypothetical protein PR048_007303 [Dryococelus australis]|uniref:Uncharacterized protein n=1 Tax=Dryococelus australis TaxID=614101 RepID=A0ABQ9IEH0_9NEOP|nr:hypothetical protein PR048_007303 [Dryococelus australis]